MFLNYNIDILGKRAVVAFGERLDRFDRIAVERDTDLAFFRLERCVHFSVHPLSLTLFILYSALLQIVDERFANASKLYLQQQTSISYHIFEKSIDNSYKVGYNTTAAVCLCNFRKKLRAVIIFQPQIDFINLKSLEINCDL